MITLPDICLHMYRLCCHSPAFKIRKNAIQHQCDHPRDPDQHTDLQQMIPSAADFSSSL